MENGLSLFVKKALNINRDKDKRFAKIKIKIKIENFYTSQGYFYFCIVVLYFDFLHF